MSEFRMMEDMLKARVDRVIEGEGHNPTSAGFNAASELGVDCDTFQAARRLKGTLRAPKSLSLQKVFRMGNVLEKPTIDLLRRAGLEVFEDPKSAAYEWPQYQIKGHIDAKMSIVDAAREKIIPVEVKTCSPNAFRAIVAAHEAGESLIHSKHIWLRRYPAQLTVYELLFNVDLGLWTFVEKSSGELLFWYLPLDYAYGEELLRRAERANANVAAGKIPDPVFKDICVRCDFCDRLCFPDRNYGPGFELVVDSTVEDDFRRMEELKPAAREFDELRKKLIGSGETPGMFYGKSVIIGDWMIEAKERTHTFYDIPKVVKDMYAQQRRAFVHTIQHFAADGKNTED